LRILENISLAAFTTFGIGGPARWFAEAATEAEIAEASEWARGRGMPLFVLGGGSNVLIADEGFPGLVLHVGMKGIDRDGELFRVAAGEVWDHCVGQTLGADCAGLECLSGIPGTVGGTPVQNVGAYGQEAASIIERVRAFDLNARQFVEFSNADCGFAYRRSRFNSTDKGRYIVTRVDYRLRENGEPLIAYQDLKAHFADWTTAPTLAETAEAVRSIRRSKGMLLVDGDPDCRSAGSFFKNPSVSEEVAERVRKIAVSAGVPLRVFPAEGELVKIPAAWLIEQAGFRKGYTTHGLGNAAGGAVGISSLHTLALVNRGGATAKEVLAFAERISEAVEARFGIRLQREPELVGFA
jgi:UDP-N-acetylmuramate dehydrogenase